MKIVSVVSARVIWLVRLIDLNPRGKYILPAVQGLVDRYKFAVPPDPKSVLASPTKIEFETGSFEAADGSPIYINLTIHDDGLVAETRNSTEESDRFLSDALTWLSTEFHLPAYRQLGVKRLYVSELNVNFDSELEVFNERFKRFSEKLSFGKDSLALINLNFGTDPATEKNQKVFRLERVLGTDFAEHRYYSMANTETSEHLALLKSLEKAATETG